MKLPRLQLIMQNQSSTFPVKGRAKGIRRPIRIYSTARRDLIAAYERAKLAEVSPSPCVTFTAMAAALIICSKVNILWARSSVPNLVAKKSSANPCKPCRNEKCNKSKKYHGLDFLIFEILQPQKLNHGIAQAMSMSFHFFFPLRALFSYHKYPIACPQSES